MRYQQLARRLRELGCEELRQAKGSHRFWRNTATNQSLRRRTGVRKIWRQAPCAALSASWGSAAKSLAPSS